MSNEEKRMLRAAQREKYFNSQQYSVDKYSTSGNKRTTIPGIPGGPKAKKFTQAQRKQFRSGGNTPGVVRKQLKILKNIGAPSMPPRSGPSSGGGGQGARYNRLTGGGLRKHGR